MGAGKWDGRAAQLENRSENILPSAYFPELLRDYGGMSYVVQTPEGRRTFYPCLINKRFMIDQWRQAIQLIVCEADIWNLEILGWALS